MSSPVTQLKLPKYPVVTCIITNSSEVGGGGGGAAWGEEAV